MEALLLQQLQAGVEAHRQGNLAIAEQNYRAVLTHAPETLDAINLLGRLLVQTGRPAEAVSQLRRAIDAAAMQGPLWISYALFISTSINLTVFRGLRGLGQAMLAIGAGVVLGGLFFGWAFAPATGWPAMRRWWTPTQPPRC